MVVVDTPMKEFLLWSNCANNCEFCWQKKLNKEATQLTETEKLESIAAVKNEISQLGYTDILIVGGEVYCPHSDKVNKALKDLFEFIAERIKSGMTRLMYANSNLIYSDRVNLDALFTTFAGIEDKLRFTTSFDVYGRFAADSSKMQVQDNLLYIKNNYPNVHPVVNTIITKQFYEYCVNNYFDINQMVKDYNLAYVNLIPYIPLEAGDIMQASWDEIVQVLLMVEVQAPHYLRYYTEQYDIQQDRLLKEYQRGVGLVPCSSSYMDCGHNVNYSRAMDDGSCYVCKVKKLLEGKVMVYSETELDEITKKMHNVIKIHGKEGYYWADKEADIGVISDEMIAKYISEGYRIITIGDTCTEHVWNTHRKPDVMIIDGRAGQDMYSSALQRVRAEKLERLVIYNEDESALQALNEALEMHMCIGTKDLVIQIIGEEDGALFPAIRYSIPGDLIIAGDGSRKAMVYFVNPKV